MKSGLTKKILALVISVCMLFTAVPMTTVSALSGNTLDAKLSEKKLNKLNSFKLNDEVVTAIVELDGESVIDLRIAGLNDSTITRRQSTLSNNQSKLLKTMKNSFSYELVNTYTVLLNAVAIKTSFSNLYKVAEMKNVKNVYLANSYTVPDLEPKVGNSASITEIDTIRTSLAATGKGTAVAVLDTGLNITHEAFAETENLGKDLAITKEDVNKTFTKQKGKYLSEKVPFSYDYADLDDDVSDKDGHGTHVSGIVLGYTEGDDGAVTFSGVAPDAQLVSMKIFNDEMAGTDSTIYFDALEDAYLLGVDVINMSIGSANGFTYDAELESMEENIYDKLDQEGVVTCVAAGNEYSMAYSNLSPFENTVISSYADYGNVGSPSTYTGNLSVASMENYIYPARVILAGSNAIEYDDSSEEVLFFNEFKGEDLHYVMIPNFGAEADYELKEVKDAIKAINGDWVAVISRGDITFQEKIDFAAEAGAVAAIIYNNEDGKIGMAVDNFSIPAVSVTKDAGEKLAANVSLTDGFGTLTVKEEMQEVENENSLLMSDFSCWGTTSDLKIKPQISAPGGMIYSAGILNNSDYVVFSGTSMATPHMSGFFACLIQASKDWSNEPVDIDDLEAGVLSTADLNVDKDGVIYSPRKQGAGIANAYSLVNTKAYIKNPLVEIGDDADKTGIYTIEFDVKSRNSSKYYNSKDLLTSYKINPIVLIDYSSFDSESNNYYNTLSSVQLTEGKDYTFTTNYNNDEIIFDELNQTKHVVVKIKLSEELKNSLDVMYENGTYIEGFIKLNDNSSASSIHSTFLGFYGDWTAAPILEKYDFRDAIDAQYELNQIEYLDENGQPVYNPETGKNYTLLEAGYTLADLVDDMTVGFNEVYTYSQAQQSLVSYLGDSILDYVKHNDNHNAISNTNSSSYFYADAMIAYPTQLRNARHLIMVVSDSKTGEIYYVDDTEYLGKAYYETEAEMYYQLGTFAWDGTVAYDETDVNYGNFVPNGTTVNVDFFGWVDYDLETEGKFELLKGDYSKLLIDDATWASKRVWSYPLTVDAEAPVFEDIDWDPATKKLTVVVSDNDYLQGFMVCDAKDTEAPAYFMEVVDGKKGEEHTFVVDLSDVESFDNGVALLALDYATNAPEKILYLSDKGIETANYEVVVKANGRVLRTAEVELYDGKYFYTCGEPVPSGEYTIYVDRYNTGVKINVGSDELVKVEVNLGVLQFKANGGVDGKVTQTYVTVGNTIEEGLKVANANKPTREGYTFDGWVLESGEKVDPSYKMTDKGLVIYALWKSGELDTDSSKDTDTDNKGFVYGDPDLDGTVSMSDVVELQKAIADLIELKPLQIKSGDVNGDARITMVDVTTIQRYIASLIEEFPIEENKTSDKDTETDTVTDRDTATDKDTETDTVSDKDTETDTVTDKDTATDVVSDTEKDTDSEELDITLEEALDALNEYLVVIEENWESYTNDDGYYTEKSYSVFLEAYENALKVYEDVSAGVEEVVDAYLALVDSVDGLIEDVSGYDKAEVIAYVQSVYEEYKGDSQEYGPYTEESFSAYEEALALVEKMLANPDDYTNQELFEAGIALENAYLSIEYDFEAMTKDRVVEILESSYDVVKSEINSEYAPYFTKDSLDACVAVCDLVEEALADVDNYTKDELIELYESLLTAYNSLEIDWGSLLG